ncbi:MAG TPA: transposase [Actinomycetota bacterium]|nr:transposase [Actinomycetota bacterium]
MALAAVLAAVHPGVSGLAAATARGEGGARHGLRRSDPGTSVRPLLRGGPHGLLAATFGSGLTTIIGIAELSAAELLAEIGDVGRYRTKAQFAMANGTAPLPASSGRIDRHRLNRGGNRQLNRIIHYVALPRSPAPRRAGPTTSANALKARRPRRRSDASSGGSRTESSYASRLGHDIGARVGGRPPLHEHRVARQSEARGDRW